MRSSRTLGSSGLTATEPDPIAALRTHGRSGDLGWERLMHPGDRQPENVGGYGSSAS
jgi:hypothetical protein